MIDEDFKLLNSNETKQGDVFVETKCLSCEHTFTINMNILRPQNCSYVLDESMTITCPACKKEATTVLAEACARKGIESPTTKEGKLAALRITYKKLREKIAKLITRDSTNIKTIGPDKGGNPLVVTMECSCGKQFTMDPLASINSKISADEMVITCPLCGMEDHLTLNSAADKYELMADVGRLKHIAAAIKELEGK